MDIILKCPHCHQNVIIDVWRDLKIKKSVICEECNKKFAIRLDHLDWKVSKGRKRKNIDINQSF